MKKNILIVDDEEFICENLKYLLEDLADEVFTALDGQSALDIIERETILCVISDINMPGMDGIELIKNVREMGYNLPFVFFTAHGNNTLMMEAVKYGAFDFIDKPNFDGLEDIVKRGLKQGFSLVQKESDQERSTDTMVNEYQELLKLKDD
jgi:DNA-binding NtrC family response regulator